MRHTASQLVPLLLSAALLLLSSPLKLSLRHTASLLGRPLALLLLMMMVPELLIGAASALLRPLLLSASLQLLSAPSNDSRRRTGSLLLLVQILLRVLPILRLLLLLLLGMAHPCGCRQLGMSWSQMASEPCAHHTKQTKQGRGIECSELATSMG